MQKKTLRTRSKFSIYGSSEVINFDREPDVSLSAGTGAEVIPIVNGGSITEVYVKYKGKDYIAPPDLQINGPGFGAVLTPILKTVGVGTTATYLLEEVKVLNKGAGYGTSTTSITVLSPGSEDVLIPAGWTVLFLFS